MYFRHQALFLVFVMVAAAICVGAQTISVGTPSEWHSIPVDNDEMNERIAEAAERYKEYAPVERTAFFDIGYPHNADEYKRMNGYAILLVSAVSQKEEELPLKRVYVTSDGETYELKLLKEFRIMEPDAGSRTAMTFGQYRVDALYLFPVFLRSKEGMLMVDFAAGRIEMPIAEFDGSTPPNLARLPKTEPETGKIPDADIKKYIAAEFPGYADK